MIRFLNANKKISGVNVHSALNINVVFYNYLPTIFITMLQ